MNVQVRFGKYTMLRTMKTIRIAKNEHERARLQPSNASSLSFEEMIRIVKKRLLDDPFICFKAFHNGNRSVVVSLGKIKIDSTTIHLIDPLKIISLRHLECS